MAGFPQRSPGAAKGGFCGSAVAAESGSLQWWDPVAVEPRERNLPPKQSTSRPRRQRAKGVKPSCASCYFGIRMLCALDLGEPCTTFRPDSAAGLVPPQQPMLLVEGAATELVAA